MNVERNVNFLLSHFDESNLFPRKMMTRHKNYQFTVYDKKELIQKCLESDLCDCRVNGYPILYKQELLSYPPNFIFIDLDLSNFMKYKNPQKMLDKILRNVLNKISASFSIEPSQHTPPSPLENGSDIQQQNLEFITEVRPTVLWSGNGYHIYLPINALILDNYEEFSPQKFPNLFSHYMGKYIGYSVSELFLLFAVKFLTEGKADPQHRPRYNSCLIRIPNTFNSKCLAKGLSKEESKVKIIQEWNGYRPPIQFLTKEFRRWLVQEEIKQKLTISKKITSDQIPFSSTNRIEWIEKLFQIPLADHRKYCLFHILIPYLLNVKKLSIEESSKILDMWLSKCNKVSPLNFSPSIEIKNRIKYVKDFKPMSLSKLQTVNLELYRFIN